MNNIGLIISGNLTGFSRFYASPNANDIYNEAKFDFDYRNFLTFLNNDDKAYAISFAPTVISVSLVTRILDSFRRPGVLVVSILLPRNKKVEFEMNAHNDKALYQLLNAIHDTFHEKNFVNGMVNQNAAVLMQDYYTDILSNFVLVPDGLQRPINSRIDVSSPNKHLGYIKSTEDDVPLYLSSLYRKSYEGYHHVFIAENAPQNIDEEPVEVVLYSVKITNNGLRLQNVKLTDNIYNLHPEDGEIDIDKNFTYQQVVNGEAGRNIIASIGGELIEITYRFGQEKREIKFSFVDGGVPVPFESICPRIKYSNGQSVNVGNEVWLFEGKEIYERKTIECGTSNYIVKNESATLDIRKQKDGSTCLIQVEKCSHVEMRFEPPYNKTKRITFRRSNNIPLIFDVADHLQEILPGKLEEYTYTIESNYYDRVTGKLSSFSVSDKIELRVKDSFQTTEISTKRGGISSYSDATSQRVETSVRRASTGGVLTLEGGNKKHTITKKDNKRKIALIGGSFAALIAVILCFVIFGSDLMKKVAIGEEEPVTAAANDSINRDLIITFIDSDGDFVKSENISINVFTRIVKTYVSNEENVEKTDSTKNGIFNWTYHVSGTASDIQELQFVCSVGSSIIGDSIVKAERLLPDSTSLNNGLRIELKVRTSEIKLYEELPYLINTKNGVVSKSEYLKLDNRIKNIVHEDFAFPLKEMFKLIKYEEAHKGDSQNRGMGDDKTNTTDSQELKAELPEAIKSRLRMSLPVSGSVLRKLEQTQKEVVENYNNWLNNIYKKKTSEQQTEIKGKLNKCSTFKGLQSVINSYKKAN